MRSPKFLLMRSVAAGLKVVMYGRGAVGVVAVVIMMDGNRDNEMLTLSADHFARKRCMSRDDV